MGISKMAVLSTGTWYWYTTQWKYVHHFIVSSLISMILWGHLIVAIVDMLSKTNFRSNLINESTNSSFSTPGNSVVRTSYELIGHAPNMRLQKEIFSIIRP